MEKEYIQLPALKRDLDPDVEKVLWAFIQLPEEYQARYQEQYELLNQRKEEADRQLQENIEKIDADADGMFGTIRQKAELAENMDTDVIHPVAEPISEQGGLAVLHGNIGTDSAIVKFSAVAESAWIFDGPAKCYDSQDDAWHAILKDEIEAGDVVVIRYEGPKGSPGMPHMETFMAAVLGKGLGEKLALVSDGRFSGATGGLAIGHVSRKL